MRNNFTNSEEKITQLKKDIHTEKHKNEVLSRRISELEKSLMALSEEFAKSPVRFMRRQTRIERNSSACMDSPLDSPMRRSTVI